MTRIILALSVVGLFHSPELLAEKVDLRNYVIGRYNANTNEVRIAKQRAIHYWQKNGPRVGEKGHYLAIEAAAVMPGDVIEPLWQNMINAQTGSGFLLPSAWNPGRMHCIMIFDTHTSSFATPEGFLVVETPHPGSLARFGDYIALYIKTGSFW
jgi:hypothetical protein